MVEYLNILFLKVMNLFLYHILVHEEKEGLNLPLSQLDDCGTPVSLMLAEKFLGALAKLQKVTFGFFMSVRQSISLHGTARLPLDRFL
jgi:hypothetical protein